LASLNGRDLETVDALRRVCKVQSPRQCARSRHAWAVWREQWPSLPVGTELAAAD
jgi:hypothetical protein